jgi:hypothetical protein
MTLEAEAAADYVQAEAPRLIKVAGATAISFALYDGANRALLLGKQQDVHEHAWQIAAGYRNATSSLHTVTVLGECLTPFDPNGVPLWLDEIDDWSNHAKLVWDAAFRTFGKLSDS